MKRLLSIFLVAAVVMLTLGLTSKALVARGGHRHRTYSSRRFRHRIRPNFRFRRRLRPRYYTTYRYRLPYGYYNDYYDPYVYPTYPRYRPGVRFYFRW